MKRFFIAMSMAAGLAFALPAQDAPIKLFANDTTTGKEVTSFPITKGADDTVYDAGSKRLYTAADGAVDVYEQTDPDHYKSIGKVPTGAMARTALLVPSLKRYFVGVPAKGTTAAEVLVFEVH